MVYTIGTIEEILRASPFDTLDTLLLAIISARNVEDIALSPERSRQYADWSHPVPDNERRPISRRALATSLRLPIETVRRRIDGLLKSGVLREVDGGVIVTGGVEGTASLMKPLFTAKFKLLVQMMEQFRAHGIDLPTDLVEAEAPPRAAAG